MSFFISADEEESYGKINIDELFEKQQQRNLKQLSIFNKILSRAQKRIQLTARNKKMDQYIWFQIPEYIFGEPIYDKGDCIAFIVDKLETNGFYVRYMHPNTLFISWKDWVPSYIRTEFKKKTGKIMNEKGIISDPLEYTQSDNEEDDINQGLMSGFNNSNKKENPKKEFLATNKYKPSGKFVYNPELFHSLENRLENS